MTAEKLNTAIQLIQSGSRQAAVPVLREILQQNPANEQAWLLLSACVDQLEQKKFCLQSVLTINPSNQQARQALEELSQPKQVEPAWNEAPDKPEWLRDEPVWAEPAAESQPMDEMEMEWLRDEPTQEPVASPKVVKSVTVKAAPPPTYRRKTRSKRKLSAVSILAGALLLIMFFTVCFVFLWEIGVSSLFSSP